MGTIEHLEALARGRETESRPTDLARIVADHVAGEWAPRFAAAGRALTAGPAGGVAARLAPEAARQVVDVLLDNALRHGAGATAVTVTDGGGWARLRVRDEGPGVPPARAEELFERGVSSGNGGGGVGLAVARELVRREGGELSLVHARPACFEAAVPAAAARW
jgi:signal transduction histidine kinase